MLNIEKTKDDKFDWRHVGLAVLIVVTILGAYFYALAIFEPAWGVEQRGQFGDAFGAANAAFSGLAFCGIIYTILLQRHELKLQREELAATRAELQRAAAAQEAAERALNSQAYAALVSTRMAAINNMLTAKTVEHERLHRNSDWNRAGIVMARMDELYRELEVIYSEVGARAGG